MQKSRVGDDAPELRIMPFRSENDEDSDYFLSVPIYNMAASKRLEDAGNENSWKRSRKYLLASALSKGKKAIDKNTSVISSVKRVVYSGNVFLDNAKDTIEKRHVVPHPFFVSSAGTEVDQLLRDNLVLYVTGGIDKKHLCLIWIEHVIEFFKIKMLIIPKLLEQLLKIFLLWKPQF